MSTNLTPPPPPGQGGNPYAGIYTPPEFAAAPPRRRRWPIVVAIVGFVILACLAGTVLVAQTGTGKTGVPSSDFLSGSKPTVTMLSCQADKDFGVVKVAYTLVNTGTSQATFMPSFRITDANGLQIGTASDVAADVLPGAKVQGEAIGSIAGTVPSKIKCTLVDG